MRLTQGCAVPGSPVFSSAAWMVSSAEDMVRPNGCGNSIAPHFLPLLNAAVSSSSPLCQVHSSCRSGDDVVTRDQLVRVQRRRA